MAAPAVALREENLTGPAYVSRYTLTYFGGQPSLFPSNIL